MGTVKLDPAALQKLGKPEFERFCFHEVLCFELTQRHAYPWGLPDGPSGKVGQTDGGRDFSLEILNAPRAPLAEFPYAITTDELGLTWYSCKNTESKGSARSLVLRDVKPSRTKLRELWSAGDPPAEVLENCQSDGTLSKQLLEILADGGRYFVLLAAQVPKKSELRKDVANELAAWCKKLLGKDVDLSQRVKIFDANDLALFINHHGVTLPQDLERVLGIESPPDLVPWRTWRERFQRDRDHPLEYEIDPGRQQKIKLVIERTQRESAIKDRYAWIAGPPGVGKTRLVLHALEKVPGHEHRVSFTEDPVAARRALSSSWFERSDDAIIVVDECSDLDAEVLIRTFIQDNGARRNALILIGPPPENLEKPRGACALLSPLPTDSICRIIRNQSAGVSLDDATLEHLASLVGGYPHYAVLVANGLGPEDAGALNGSSRWDVAQRALAGRPNDGSDHEWRQRVNRRAKALMAIAIVPTLPWDDLDPTKEEALAQALSIEFPVLRDAATECEKRGMLRHVRSQGHQYISPMILGGIILDHFLGGGPNPGGPTLGRRIKRELPEHYGTLCDSARRYAVSDDIRRRLVEHDLTEPDVHTWERLDELAFQSPESTARSLPRLLRQYGPDDILDSDLRDTVYFALVHLSRRRIELRGFAQVEDALFGLAVAASRRAHEERRRHGGVSLQQLVHAWESLFSPHGQTHRPLAERLAVLERRSHDGSAEHRAAVARAITTSLDDGALANVIRSRDLIDGEWPPPSAAEHLDAEHRLHRLQDALISDEDEMVAGVARRGLAETLHTRLGTEESRRALRAIAARARSWTTSQKRVLQQAIDDHREVRRAREEHPDRDVEGALAELEGALVVEDLVGRVMMRVGRWVPDPRLDEDDLVARTREGDGALALELLEAPSRWERALCWLEQPDALRSADFLTALGMADLHDHMLETLTSRLPGEQASRTLAMYLRGRHERLGDEATNAWVKTALSRPHAHLAIARLLSLLPGHDERIAAVLTLLEAATLDPDAREQLGLAPWSSPGAVSPRALRAASRRAFERDGASGLVVVLGDALLRTNDAPLEDDLVDGLVSALRAHVVGPSHGSNMYKWQSLARQLFALRYSSRVLEVLLDALATDGDIPTRLVLDMLEELVEHVSLELFWQLLRPRLGSQRLTTRFYYHRGELMPLLHLPADEALAAARDDPPLAEALGELSRPYQPSLEPLALRLISELGADGPAARAIEARAASTPQPVHSLGRFHLAQSENAREWAKSSSLEVRRWAERLADRLAARADDELASEELERKLG